ncbi:MAG: fumarate hydratase [Atribacteria sp.]|nr:fumarate hydratase [Candidatus Atribacteria bacterium]MBU4047202.1 fumarate hydratase [bacterium]
MRKIEAGIIKKKVKELFLRANYYIGEDVLTALKEAREGEVSEVGCSVLDMLIENYKIASGEEIAICQDTGLAVLYVELGQEVYIIGGNFREAVNEGVKEAYMEGYLRKSIVDDPVFARKNTGTNTPAIIYTDIVPGDKIKFMVTPKGFGSENMSALAMMKPADGPEGIKNFVVDTIKKAGPNPCPPTIVGVGIGGTADKALVIAKKALFRKIGEHHQNERYAQMEKEILERINNLGIGPAGLGGRTTALAVNIEYTPTHIAGMPVAVNVCCHAARHAEGIL